MITPVREYILNAIVKTYDMFWIEKDSVLAVIKVLVFAYIIVIPLMRLHKSKFDLMPLFVSGFVVGAALLTLDVTLGTLVLLAASVTTVVMCHAPEEDERDAAEEKKKKNIESENEYMSDSEDVVLLLPEKEGGGDDNEPPSEDTEAIAEDIVDSEPAATLEAESEEMELGPRYLLQPDGYFVTPENLTSAQNNLIGADNAFAPLGGYSAQGMLSGTSLTGSV